MEPIDLSTSGLAGLDRAIQLAGGQAALARRLDEIGQRQTPPMHCKPQNVWAWKNRDKQVPGEWARFVAEAVDFQVLPLEVRRDLYPHPDDGVPPERRRDQGSRAAA